MKRIGMIVLMTAIGVVILAPAGFALNYIVPLRLIANPASITVQQGWERIEHVRVPSNTEMLGLIRDKLPVESVDRLERGILHPIKPLPDHVLIISEQERLTYASLHSDGVLEVANPRGAGHFMWRTRVEVVQPVLFPNLSEVTVPEFIGRLILLDHAIDGALSTGSEPERSLSSMPLLERLLNRAKLL